MFVRCLFAALLAFSSLLQANQPAGHRLLFLGDSITYNGTYIAILEAAFIAQHPNLNIEFLNLGLASETVSGLSEEGHANGQFPRPDLHERLDRVLTQTKPDWVLACYGMNDGIYHPLSGERFAAYQRGIERLRARVQADGIGILHLTPPVFDPLPIQERLLPAGLDAYPQSFAGYNDVLDAYSDWLIEQSRKKNWHVIDLHGPMKAALAAARVKNPAFSYAKDGVHPDAAGHLIMAQPLLTEWAVEVDTNGAPAHPNGPAILALVKKKQALLRDAWLTQTGHKRPGVKAGPPLPEAQAQAAKLDQEARRLAREGTPLWEKNSWYGYPKREIDVGGKKATVVSPILPAPGKPWAWHGEFFGHRPEPDIALLGHGVHLVSLHVPDLLGSPEAMKHWDHLYQELTRQQGFAKKAALVGLSRGGLYCYHWALAHPERVACIYADAPVCDFKSWPGGKGKGKGDPKNWVRVLALWNFPNEAAALAWDGNPVDQIHRLVPHRIPLLHVFGDADDVVPWEENTKLIHERYTALGGPIELIRKPGVGHHPHGLDDPAPIIEFILRHTKASND